GEPFPILHGEDGEIVGVDPAKLPVELPPMEDFRPTGTDDPEAPPQPTLFRAPESWKTVEQEGRTYQRELNTMPQWAGSCWYYLRYLDPENRERMVDPAKEKYFMSPSGVDLYVGGVEHGVLHLLYARFWHKVLFDLGHVSTPEPFGKLFNQGYIQAYAYQDERGMYVDASAIQEEPDGRFTYRGETVTRTLGKMGKSLKNSVSPDETLEQYGCDTLRLYEMYLGPVDASKIWNTHAIVGVHRFLQRVWRNLVDEDSGALRVTDEPADPDLRRLTHRTIAAVTADMEQFGFNTAIARLIELNNALVQRATVPREVAEPLVLMLAPQAPHIAEELWERMGHAPSICHAPWPSFEEAYLAADEIEVVVQVLGKKRGSVKVPVDASEEQIQAAALADESIAKHVEGKTIRKVIYVPGKLLNIVAN
ncbi:MAG: class I tRNA ligase family protein, partial [Candidatus Eisenbacteria bacterium]|nr:class I tRNA ligase family protein [Candidatus Eisenbacteria bacterium]